MLICVRACICCGELMHVRMCLYACVCICTGDGRQRTGRPDATCEADRKEKQIVQEQSGCAAYQPAGHVFEIQTSLICIIACALRKTSGGATCNASLPLRARCPCLHNHHSSLFSYYSACTFCMLEGKQLTVHHPPSAHAVRVFSI